jgi:hypothetical protein
MRAICKTDENRNIKVWFMGGILAVWTVIFERLTSSVVDWSIRSKCYIRSGQLHFANQLLRVFHLSESVLVNEIAGETRRSKGAFRVTHQYVLFSHHLGFFTYAK